MNKRFVVSYTVSFALIALVALVVLKSNPKPQTRPNLDGKKQIQPVAVTQAPPHVQTAPTPKTQNTHTGGTRF